MFFNNINSIEENKSALETYKTETINEEKVTRDPPSIISSFSSNPYKSDSILKSFKEGKQNQSSNYVSNNNSCISNLSSITEHTKKLTNKRI